MVTGNIENAKIKFYEIFLKECKLNIEKIKINWFFILRAYTF